MIPPEHTHWVEDASLVMAPISGHSKGKLKRQRAIIDAARTIMAESGEAGLTMSAVASRAGVSPATPYNLFGSKQAILQAVYDEDLRDFHAKFDQQAGIDPLRRLFDLADLTIRHWGGSPDFYQALLHVLTRIGGAGVEGAWSPGRSYARELVRGLHAAGGMVADAPIEAIATALVRMLRSIGQEWVEGGLTLEQAHGELGQAFGLVLTGFLTPATARAMAGMLKRYSTRLPCGAV